MLKNSKAKCIQNYIISKIQTKAWKENEKILSQSQLAKKFGCSLLTVRTVLSNFVYSGILYSWHGRGFFVQPNANEQMFGSMADPAKFFRQKMTVIENFKMLPEINKLINKIQLSIDKQDIRMCFAKSYYNYNNNLIYHQISFLNKNSIFKVDTKMIKKSLINFLLKYGTVPSRFTETVIWNKLYVLDNAARKMGWQSNYPIIVTTLFNESWIGITIKITNSNQFIFSKHGQTFL